MLIGNIGQGRWTKRNDRFPMMQWLRRRFGGGTKTATLAALQNLLGGIPLEELKNYQSYLRAGSQKVWACWRAGDIIGNSVSNTPWAVSRQGSTTPVQVSGLAELLAYPNDTMTFRELVYVSVLHISFTGNAFWFKAEATKNGDRPRQLFPLNPKRIEIVPDMRAGTVLGYRYHTDAGVQITLGAGDVIHFKRPHPDNDYWGLGPIEAGGDLFQEHINRNLWQKQFWKNGAAPSMLLVRDDEQAPDEVEWQRAKAKFNAEYTGAENAGKIAWLSGKWRKEQLGLTAAEMQNIEASKWNVEQIFLQMGVPLSVAGIRDAANFATADIDNQRFKEFTVLPLVLLMQDAINSDLVTGYGPRLQLSFNVSGLINMGKVLTDLAPAFDRGIMSINEIRAALRLEVDAENELWNQHFISAGLVPLELSGVADLQQVDQQAQQAVQRFVNQALATKRNDSESEIQPNENAQGRLRLKAGTAETA